MNAQSRVHGKCVKVLHVLKKKCGLKGAVERVSRRILSNEILNRIGFLRKYDFANERQLYFPFLRRRQ